MKKWLTVLLICLTLLFGVLFVSRTVTINNIRTSLAKTTFYAIRTLDERLNYAVFIGELTAADSEKCIRALTSLETARVTAAVLDGQPIGEYAYYTFDDLTDALGCRYSAHHNGIPVAAIRLDGVTSAEELAFLAELAADVREVKTSLLGEDDLNPSHDLTWDDCAAALTPLLNTWGDWFSPVYNALIVD